MIWAQDKRGVIGANGTVPWSVPEDLARVESVTKDHPVVMGRRTWDSLPETSRPVPARANYVISRNDELVAEGATVVRSLDEALEAIDASSDDEAWIIGGGQIFSEAVGQANVAVVTEINHAYYGETYAPGLGSEWSLISTEPATGWSKSTGGIEFRIHTYRKNAP
jgi:dihydrofolate reductase